MCSAANTVTPQAYATGSAAHANTCKLEFSAICRIVWKAVQRCGCFVQSAASYVHASRAAKSSIPRGDSDLNHVCVVPDFLKFKSDVHDGNFLSRKFKVTMCTVRPSRQLGNRVFARDRFSIHVDRACFSATAITVRQKLSGLSICMEIEQ